MHLMIEYQNGEKRQPLEIDLNESIEFLRMQLYSLTDIPPHSQDVIGLKLPAGMTSLKDTTLLRDLGLKDGERIIVKTKLTQPQIQPVTTSSAAASTPAIQANLPSPIPLPQPSSTPTRAFGPLTPPMLYPNSSPNSQSITLRACCSRSFFGEEALVQPAAILNGRPICLACVDTCCSERQALQPKLTLTPMVCQCAEITESSTMTPTVVRHECLFAVRSRVAKDRLLGAVAVESKMALEQVAINQLDAQLAQGKASFQQRIGAHIRAVLEYEDPSWQRAALEKIPVDRLRQDAQKALDSGESKLHFQDQLMVQLLQWFKHEFFQWVSSPPCDTCQAGTQGMGGTYPNETERQYRAGMVELYKCNAGHITRFPRYNHAVKLLETHRGRCGEWEQAFTLCCRAMGFETRSIHDWTDHVWSEYYSTAERRWIHLDPCENRRDAPLLYEAGWGKKLTYVIASSKDEVVDVTQRYTKKWTEVQERRTLVPEKWLQMYLQSLNGIKFVSLPLDRQQELTARREVESAEFRANVDEELKAQREAKEAEARAAKDDTQSQESGASASSSSNSDDLTGRTTGSVEWRLARGELGATDAAKLRAIQETDDGATGAKNLPSVDKSQCSTDPLNPSALESLTISAKNSTTPAPVANGNTGASVSPPSTSTTNSVASPSASLAAAKERTAALFRTYVNQLTKGCGRTGCKNTYCRTNPDFQTSLVGNDAHGVGALALKLTKQGQVNLCSSA